MSSLEDKALAAGRTPARFAPKMNEEGAQAALDYLQATVPLVGDAYEELEMAEEMIAVVRARAFRLSGEKTEALRTAEALCSAPYEEALKRKAKAKAALKQHEAARKTAEMTITAWQSAEKTRNSMRI